LNDYLRFMKILLIEDEAELTASIATYLRSNQVICESVATLNAALDKISVYDYDCILLDLNLPDGDGFKVLSTLKKLDKTEGVIITSAKDTLPVRLEGLQLGADDFLTKPFHLSELLARIQALVRRKQFNGKNTVRFQEIEIDILSKTVKVNDELVELTKKETELLLFLVGNQTKVLSKAALAEHLSGDMADMLDNHGFVYAHVKNLKKKLSDAGCGDYIKTVYGLGYKWQA
jgi:DNA-binding response OmpR family regulator